MLTPLSIEAETEGREHQLQICARFTQHTHASVAAGKGHQTILAFRKGQRAVFVYGFAKSDMGNIDAKQLEAFKKLAPVFLNASDDTLSKMLNAGELAEVSCDEEKGESKKGREKAHDEEGDDEG